MVTLTSRQLTVASFAIIAGLVLQAGGEKQWWQTTTIYQIWPKSFKDSDGDGYGDLNGITSKLEHLNDMGVETIWISPFFKSPQVDNGYDISDYLAIDPIYGTLEDFDNLAARAKELGVKVILDYVPNHSSTEHEWFKLSENSVDPYTDYYVWNKGILDDNGTRRPPNNWLNVFGTGSSWEWSDKRQAYYLHQFDVTQAELNFTNPRVIEESKNILTFWLDHGCTGFRIDAAPYLIEDPELRDEPLLGVEGYSPTDFFAYNHIYTKDLLELYPIIQIWRDHVDEYTAKVNDGVERVIFTEGYANISMVMLYYDYGSHLPFNFFLIADGDTIYSYTVETQTAQGIKDAIDQWMELMPEGGTANWVIGNHDRSRVPVRYGSEKVDTFNFMLLLLPGVPTIYYGEEIGMTGTFTPYDEMDDASSDPHAKQEFSRAPQRTPFQWNNLTSAGFSTSTTTHLKLNDNYLTLNLEAQKAADKSNYKNFQAAMKLRNSKVAQDGNLTTLVIDDVVFAFSRELDGYDPLLVVFNWSNSSVTISLNDFSNFCETLEVLLSDVNSEIEVGSTISRNRVTLPGHAALVLTSS